MNDTSRTFSMIDVGAKAVTRRRAVATGSFRAAKETLARVLAGNLPKGEVLKMAEVAGIAGAKKTSDLLPLCHPLQIDSVRISFKDRLNDPETPEIQVFCEVICHGKTGVEMEALAGVQIALLCIYDLTKGIDPVLEMGQVHLLEKEGGKSGHWIHHNFKHTKEKTEPSLQGARAAVLTVSDRCSRGESVDRTGPKIKSAFEMLGATVCADAMVPDEIEAIRETVLHWIQAKQPDVIVLTGGTGISSRDLTPEAMKPLWDKILPGFGELFRRRGATKTSMAWLSRAEAGLVGKTLVFTLPGSRGAVEDGIEILSEVLPHTLEMVRDGGHP